MEDLKKEIKESRFYDFMESVTDNDTIIIVGLLLIVAWVVQDIQMLIVGGLLATLKTSKGKP